MAHQLDLTAQSTTFPDLPEPQIPRDNLITLLRDRFGPDRKVIAVQGVLGAGKTTLLAQFAKTYCDRSLSFFAESALPAWQLRFFLLDMCEQLARLLGKETKGLVQFDMDRLEQEYSDLYRTMVRRAKAMKLPHYLVVDGLEGIVADSSEANIISLLPKDPTPYVYILASAQPGRDLDIAHDRWDIPFFALRDTEVYLEGLGLGKEDIQRVHKSCQGMPGYLAAIRRLRIAGTNLSDLPEKLPAELRGLFDFEWKTVDLADGSLLRALAVLAYSKESLTVATLAQMLSLDEEDLQRRVPTTSFLKQEPETHTLTFVSDAYKEMVAERLRARRADAESLLVEFYAQDPYAEHSLMLLPTYLAESGGYDRLRSLVTMDYLARALESRRDTRLLRRTLKVAAQQAWRSEDWQGLSKYALACSIVTSLSKQPVAVAEVECLLQIGESEQAFRIASGAVLAEDRIQLLARVYSHMRQEGIPIPVNVRYDLEQMAATIDLTGLQDRAIEIAAVLFDVAPQAAIGLVERTAGAPSLDKARAALALRLETDPSELVGSRITDQTLRDFVKANSPRVASLTASEVIAEAEEVSDTSGKLFLLTTWCNRNRRNPRAIVAAERALEIITGDPTYGTSMRLLRQIAEPLMAIPDGAPRRVIDRLDLLKNTAIKQPAEEAIRLELVLSALEAKQWPEAASNRLFEAYLGLDEIPDLDVRCYCLVRILITLPEIEPGDARLKQEVENRLVHEYESLLADSADHLAVTQRLLRALTAYDPVMALRFADQLNLAERRDRVFRDMLWVYADRPAERIDLAFVDRVLAKISEPERRDRALVRLIERLATLGLLTSMPQTRRYLQSIQFMKDPRNRCFATAFAVKALAAENEGVLVQDLTKQLSSALEMVDAQWERVSLSFDLAAVVAESAPETARLLLDTARTARLESPLAEESFASMYVGTVRLALRAFSGMAMVDGGRQDRIERLLQAIRQVPSCDVQCQLCAEMALRYHLCDADQVFKQLCEEQVLPLLESNVDEESQTRTLVAISPCLYEYDQNWALEKLSGLSKSRKDEALTRITLYLLTKRVPGDPVDLELMSATVDVRTARRVCEVTLAMSRDAAVFSSIERLVDALVHRDRRNPEKEVCESLVERDALEIADKLNSLTQKFPDPDNIQHNGYLVATQAAIARLRAAAARRQKYMAPIAQIRQDAEAVPNAADRAFVLALAGQELCRVDASQARAMIREAEEMIPQIPSIIDRAERFQHIAKAWQRADDKESAKMLLKEAMTLLQAWSWDRTRDEVTGQVLQLAHALDPDFAATLTPLVDNPVAEHMLRLRVAAEDLEQDPKRMAQEKQREAADLRYVLSRAAWRMLESLNSGTGKTIHPKDVGQWLLETIGSDFEHSLPVLAWSVQNTVQYTHRSQTLLEMYQGILDCMQLCMALGKVTMGIKALIGSMASQVLPDSIQLFRAGSRAASLQMLADWLNANVKDYVKIYDPYFSVADLSILKQVAADTQVFIVTSWREQGVEVGDRAVESLYRDAWSRISRQPPPWTNIVVVGIRSGKDSPLHSRYIITKGKGLLLGTSIESLGNKESYLHALDALEASRIESEVVNPQLAPQLSLYKGEPLVVWHFML